MTSLDTRIEAAMQAIAARGQSRMLVPARLREAGRLERGGAALLDFSSNDYLGLALHPLLIERSAAFARELGAGAGASRLVTGTSEAHLALEARIAAFKGTEAALLFASGWQANAAVLPALIAAAPGACVLTDKLNHASLHQGCAAARVRQTRFRHNDLAHLDDLLSQNREAPARLIVTESVFSMDGDVADLAALSELARRHDAFLFVDEAHATGVLGPGGAGLSAAVPGGVDLVMGTFSKAMGSFGAYVAGSRRLCDYLANTASGFVFSTAPPPAVLGAIDAALDLVPGMEGERAHLAAMAAKLREGLRTLGLDTLDSTTQIVPAVIGPEDETMVLGASLATRGIAAAAIRPPTVPRGASRLRFALRSTHTEADIDAVLHAVRQCR
jgi:8-amino-7-oxononanoate synthase